MDGRRHASATLAAWLKMRLRNFYQKLRRPFVTIAQPARHNRAAKLNSARGRPSFCEANWRSRCFEPGRRYQGFFHGDRCIVNQSVIVNV